LVEETGRPELALYEWKAEEPGSFSDCELLKANKETNDEEQSMMKTEESIKGSEWSSIFEIRDASFGRSLRADFASLNMDMGNNLSAVSSSRQIMDQCFQFVS